MEQEGQQQVSKPLICTNSPKIVIIKTSIIAWIIVSPCTSSITESSWLITIATKTHGQSKPRKKWYSKPQVVPGLHPQNHQKKQHIGSLSFYHGITSPKVNQLGAAWSSQPAEDERCGNLLGEMELFFFHGQLVLVLSSAHCPSLYTYSNRIDVLKKMLQTLLHIPMKRFEYSK